MRVIIGFWTVFEIAGLRNPQGAQFCNKLEFSLTLSEVSPADNQLVTTPGIPQGSAASILGRLAQSAPSPSRGQGLPMSGVPVDQRQEGLGLLERLAARHRETGQVPVSSGPPGRWAPAGDPERFFIAQVTHPRYNPDAPSATANCGPASLAMALLAFHRVPAQANRQALVMQVRQLMTGRQDAQELTSEVDVTRGAQAAGLKSRYVETLAEVEAAVRQGELVVLAGNPAAYNKQLSSEQYVPFDGGHFVLVAGLEGDRWLVSDPYSLQGPLLVSREAMEQFMAYRQWNVGVAVRP